MHDYRVKCGAEFMDRVLIHSEISQTYWAKGIPFDVMSRAIDNSLCFGVFTGSNQVAFARLITDNATFAYLADVFVLKPFRGQGLSKLMLASIVNHPELQGLRRMVLATRDAHELYRQFGFTALADASLFMERWDPAVYE